MTQTGPAHVAIVGCGFTGTTALHQLVDEYPVRRITVYESDGEFGPGFPYQPTESRHYLINNTNDTMCLEPSDRRAFLTWLQRQPHYSTGLEPKGHMPRAVYGEFLRAAVDAARARARNEGIALNFIGEACSDIEEFDNAGVALHSASGIVRADKAILATGRCPDVDIYGLEEGCGRYFATHIPGTLLKRLPVDATVHILGASLSAYDVVNELFSPDTGCEFVPDGNNRLRFIGNENGRHVVLCSRSGRLKKTQSRNPLDVRREHFISERIASLPTRGTTIEDIVELMSKDAELNDESIDVDSLLDPYRGCRDVDTVTARAAALLRNDIDAGLGGHNFVVDYLERAQFDIWDLFAARKLSEPEESRFRARVESALLSYSAPCPIPTAQRLLALMDSGRLRVVSGIRSVSREGAGFRIEHPFGVEMASFVVNATGAVDRHVASRRQPALVRNLHRRGLLRAYRLNGEDAPGLDVDMRTFRCLGARNIHAANMFLWGPGFFVSSAIVMASVVRQLLGEMFRDP